MESVEEVDEDARDGLRCYLSGGPNVRLTLKKPHVVTMALGMERSSQRILLALEEHARFLELWRRLAEHTPFVE